VADLKLSIAFGDYEIFRPLTEGRVKPKGIELIPAPDIGSRERHWEMARGEGFDVCEFNACAYFMARDRNYPLTAIPVFGHRRFRHSFVFVNTAKNIDKPTDLIGKRVGGTNFQPAGNIWARGILQELYNVPHDSMTWVTERGEDVPFTPHPTLRIERAPEGSDLDEMLATGELDAMISPEFPKPILRKDPRVARLFRNYKQVETDYYRSTGIFPIMHVTVVKQSVIAQHPWVAASLMRAFEESKALAYKRVANPRIVPLAFWSWALDEQQDLLGDDPWQYGLTDANRRNLETAIRYTHLQGLTSRQIPIEELFVS
jgi:4,5-dihydroxyphthalate decarboxylase